MDDLTPNQNKNQHATLNGNYKFIVRGGNNYIHPTAIIGDDVVLGEDNYIGAFYNKKAQVIKGEEVYWVNDEGKKTNCFRSSKPKRTLC